MAKKNDYTAKSYKSTLKKPAISSGIMVETLDEHLRKEKPEYNYNDKTFKGVYDQVMNRKDFSFDVNESALYNQYKDMHQKQGQMAMMDTMGQAAAMSGGYGNSYAAAAGMQAYQQNLDKLTEKVPELYQLAMQQYQLEGQNLQDKYNAGYNERKMAYEQYRDEVKDYQWGSDFYSGLYQDAVKNEQDFAAYNLDVAGHNLDVADHNAGLEQWRQEFAQTVKMDDEKLKQWAAEHGLKQDEFEHLKYMDGEKLKQWAAEHGLDVKELEHLIEMDEWEKERVGRSG